MQRLQLRVRIKICVSECCVVIIERCAEFAQLIPNQRLTQNVVAR